ncbi:hypothetical protein VPNG_01702 [Cytospora leucostoma]|uniref:Autophagy-related protein 27 n=1 Tax=Cytospora leucostoma TaxID=1230097 RepID=A0A423XJP4_9PEZI|nr:hypothetical protein VPNG_01702 [Cytospora leucostoma]
MRGLLKAGVLLAPVLAGAVALEEDSIPSAVITLHLPESGEPTTSQDLVFVINIQESHDACGYGNVTIESQNLLESGSGSLPMDKDRVVDATWNFTCVTWNGKPQEQLLSLNIDLVDGQPIEDVGFTIRFQQVAPVWISDIEGSASMTRLHSLPQGGNDEHHEIDLDAEMAELDFLRWQMAELSHVIRAKEDRLAEAFGWDRRPGHHVEDCDSLRVVLDLTDRMDITGPDLMDTVQRVSTARMRSRISLNTLDTPMAHTLRLRLPLRMEGLTSTTRLLSASVRRRLLRRTASTRLLPHLITANTHPLLPRLTTANTRLLLPRLTTANTRLLLPRLTTANTRLLPRLTTANTRLLLPRLATANSRHLPQVQGSWELCSASPTPIVLPLPCHGSTLLGNLCLPVATSVMNLDMDLDLRKSQCITREHGDKPHRDGYQHPDEPERPHRPEDHQPANNVPQPEIVAEEQDNQAAAEVDAEAQPEDSEDTVPSENFPDFEEPELRRDFEHGPPNDFPPHHGGPHEHGDFPGPPPHRGPLDGPHVAPPNHGPGPHGPPPPGPPPHGSALKHITSALASLCLFGVFASVLYQRYVRKSIRTPRRYRGDSNAPWFKKVCFGPHYYVRSEDEEKEAMLRGSDEDSDDEEGSEGLIARDISEFRIAADVVSEMVAVEDERMMAHPRQSSQSSVAPMMQQTQAYAPSHAIPTNSIPMPRSNVQLTADPATMAAMAAMFPDLHHAETADELPAYQEADRDSEADADEYASSMVSDGYRPGCAGASYTPSESGSQGASDILGDMKN